MILKFVYPASDRVDIVDNVKEVTYTNSFERERAYIGKNNEPVYKQRIDVCRLTEEDIKNVRKDEEGEYITFRRITYHDILRDVTISVVYDCTCYICNDNGKTIDRV